MERILLLQIVERSSSIPPPPPTITQTLPSPSSSTFNLDSKITPSILLIIVILAIIFFVSGLLHLLVRFLLRPNTRSPDESDTVTALQGQLQQLFHLHDAGVDQSFIDTLPVFQYKAIIGVKDPFDCAVCLCEFEPEDKLRLLPKCSHAFHMDCIDTWLLSHSTCPLCRASLIPEFSGQGNFTSPIVCVLESGSDTSREIGGERDGPGFVRQSNESNSFMGFQRDGESGSDRMKSISQKEEAAAVNACGGGGVTVPISVGNSGEKIVMVKLGKFKNVDGSGEGSSEATNKMSTSRRCYSMGSFAYVMDDKCSLQVPIGKTPSAGTKKPKKPGFLPLKPGHRSAVSEYGSDSRREFNGLEAFKSIEIHDVGGGIGSTSVNSHEPTSKSERFSISKIWARGEKKESGGNGNNVNGGESSKRVFSSRFAGRQSIGGGGSVLGDVSRRTISEIETDEGLEYDGGGSWLDDQETHSCYSVDSQAMMPSSSSSSTTRRTLLWLMGRQQNKVLQLPQHLRTPSCSNV